MQIVKVLLPLWCLLVGSNPGSNGQHSRYLSSNWTFLRNILKTDFLENKLKINEDLPYSFVMSPLSLEIVMMVLKHGAMGNTLRELEEVIGSHRFISKGDHGHGAIRTLLEDMKALNNEKKLTLHAANRIYLSKSFKPNPFFIRKVNAWYDLDVKSINFNLKVTAAKEINKWVERRTNNKIQDLVDPNELSKDTQMVLVNTLYFSGGWASKFWKPLTKPDIFYSFNNVITKKLFMSQIATVNSFHNSALRAKILDLPFVGGNISMTILLPDDKSGLKEDWDTISTYYVDFLVNFEGGIGLLKPTYTHIKIPKFKIETSMDAIPLLKQMGINKVFDQDASQLDLISSDLYVNVVKQKTYIDVNEDGVEAASATEVGVLVETSLPIKVPRKPDSFIADHPFLFTIRKKPENEVLFLGLYGGE